MEFTEIESILQQFDTKTRRDLRRKALTAFVKRVNTLGRIVKRRVRGSNNPIFGVKAKRDATALIYGAYQNPADVPQLFYALPSTNRKATRPHPVQIDDNEWIYTSSNQVIMYSLSAVNPKLRVTFAYGSGRSFNDYYFYRSPRTNQIFAATRKYPHHTEYIEVNYSAPDAFEDMFEFDEIALEAWQEVLSEVTL